MIWILEAILLLIFSVVYIFSSNELEQKYILPFLSSDKQTSVDINKSIKEVNVSELLRSFSLNTKEIKIDYTALLDGVLHIKYLNLGTLSAQNISDIVTGLQGSSSSTSTSIIIDNLKVSLSKIAYGQIKLDDINFTLSNLVVKDENVRISHINVHSSHIDFASLDLSGINASTNALFVKNGIFTSGDVEAGLYYNDNNGSHILRANGTIESNKLYFSTNLSSDVLTQYLPSEMNKNAYDDLNAIFVLDEEGVQGDISSGASQLFKEEQLKKYNVSAPWIQSHLEVSFEDPILYLDSKAYIDSSLGSLELTNHLIIDEDTTFDGNLSSENFNITPINDILNRDFFKDLHIYYTFNKDGKLDFAFLKEGMELNVTSEDYRFYDSDLVIHNTPMKQILDVNVDIKMNVDAKFQSDTENSLKTDGNYFAELDNLCLFDGNLSDSFYSKGSVSCYKNVLPKFIKHDMLFPLKYSVDTSKELKVDFKKGELSSGLVYNTKSKQMAVNMKLGEYNVSVAGTYDKEFQLKGNFNIDSCSKFQKSISKYYTLDQYNIECNASLNFNIDGTLQDPNFNTELLMNEIDYSTKDDIFRVDSIKSSLTYYGKNIIVDYYNIKMPSYDFYTNEPTKMAYKKSKLYLKNLSLYDKNIAKGWYDFSNSTAKFKIQNSNFHYKDSDVDINTSLDLRAKYELSSLKIDGNATIKQATIFYDYKQQVDPLDEDIVILQEQENPSWINKFLELDINVKNLKPIVYKNENVEVSFNTDLNIKKRAYENIRPIGTLWLVRGYYDGFGRTFRLQPSEVILSDEKNLNPYLNIFADVKTSEAQINVNLVGRMSDPEVYFSSSPAMSESDILSLILFDSRVESLTNEQAGTLNYSLLSMSTIFSEDFANRMGMRINRLNVIRTQDGKTGFEVGARVNSRISVGYIVDESSRGKVQYDITDNAAFDVETGQDFSAIDLIFHMQY